MEAVYPAHASALSRGRRVRTTEPRNRHRTTPVTFAEIKEVDEESVETETCPEPDRCGAVTTTGPRRRHDVLEERLGPQFAEFRRRRARRRDVLRERDHESPPPISRAGSEPSALHHAQPDADT